MKPLHMTLAAIAAAAVVALGAGSVPALAQKPTAKTPNNFAYEIRNGQRVPKGKRVTAADGSWKEEIRDGSCVMVKERTASGEYREVRKCD